MVDTRRVDVPPGGTAAGKPRRKASVSSTGVVFMPLHPARPRTAMVVEWCPVTRRRAAGPILPCSVRPGEESHRAVLRCHFADVPLPED